MDEDPAVLRQQLNAACLERDRARLALKKIEELAREGQKRGRYVDRALFHHQVDRFADEIDRGCTCDPPPDPGALGRCRSCTARARLEEIGPQYGP